MNTCTDTRQLLADALKALSCTKCLSKISISAIVKEAKTSRSNFYYYFNNKADLIAYIFKTDISDRYTVAAPDIWKYNTLHLLNVFHQNIAFYTQVIRTESSGLLFELLYESSRCKTEEYLEIYLNGRELDPASKNYLSEFYGHAFAQMNMEYILEGATLPPDQAVQLYYDVCELSLRVAIDNLVHRYAQEKVYADAPASSCKG